MTSANTPTTGHIDATEGMPRIVCGCGFLVTGVDEVANVDAFEAHPCPNRPVQHTPWWGFIFSFWGWAIVATVAYAVGAVFHAKGW